MNEALVVHHEGNQNFAPRLAENIADDGGEHEPS